MKKVEALIHPFRLDEIKAGLETLGVDDITVSEVTLSGRRNTIPSHYRGCEYQADVPRMKVEILLSANCVDDVVDSIASLGCVDRRSDDRTILVYEVSDVIRIAGGRRVEHSPALRERSLTRGLLHAASPAA